MTTPTLPVHALYSHLGTAIATSPVMLSRREEMVVGSIDGPLVVENIIGDELRDEVVRVARVAIREEV